MNYHSTDSRPKCEMNNELEKEGAYKRILYTIKSHGDKKRYKVDLILYRQEGKLRMLMVNKKCTLKARECIMLYKKRVSIETPYRMKHLAKAWTTSKKPVLRTVLFGMSCLLYTFWAIYREVIVRSAVHQQRTSRETSCC